VADGTDMQLTIRAPSMKRIHQIRDQINSVEGIRKIKTHVVMAEYINELCLFNAVAYPFDSYNSWALFGSET